MPDVGPLAELLQIPPEYYEYAVKQSIGTWRARKKDKERLEREHLKGTVARLHKTGVIAAFLYKYYDLDPAESATLFKLAGWTYPIYVEPNWVGRLEDDRVLERPLERDEYRIEEEDSFNKAKAEYLDYLKTMERVRYDGQTFRLIEILSNDSGFRLRCGPGSYFNYLATCESLADELVLQLHQNKVEDKRAFSDHAHVKQNVQLFENIKKSLPNRSLFAPTLDKLGRVAGRDSKIGLNIFFALRTADVPVCFLYHRGKNVAEYPDINHVMPAGTFQHDGRASLAYDQYDKAYSVKYKVLSEFWEECFEGKDFQAQRKMLYGGRIDFDEAKIPNQNLCPIVDLLGLLEKRKAFIYVTGLGLDLLSAKPELTIALIINDESFAKKYHDHWKFNWEFQGFGTENQNAGIHICSLNDTKSIRALLKPGMVIPAGAMAVALGFRLIRQLKAEGQLEWDVPEL
ncbi:MAG: hypothetical protein M3461_11215 [Pseudomonadota bacterium]|nr:hypothetical protein [Pseudomonadota bacterium]